MTILLPRLRPVRLPSPHQVAWKVARVIGWQAIFILLGCVALLHWLLWLPLALLSVACFGMACWLGTQVGFHDGFAFVLFGTGILGVMAALSWGAQVYHRYTQTNS